MSTRVRPPRQKYKEKIRRIVRRERYNQRMSVVDELLKQHVQELIDKKKMKNELVDNVTSEDNVSIQDQENVEGASTSFEKNQSENKWNVGSVPYGSCSSEILSNTFFESLTNLVSKKTLKAIEHMGLKTMTHVQAQCIPPLLEGYNLIGSAKPGSGKTLAFLIPAIELVSKLKFQRKHGIGCIIISPTRELAVHTCDILKPLMAYHSQSYGIAVDDTDVSEELKILSTQGMNILVATPGRLCYHLENSPKFHLKNLKYLVFDEVDLLFEIGFETEIRKIVKALPKMRRQTVIVTATVDENTEKLSKVAINRTPMRIDVKDEAKNATIGHVVQGYVVCPSDKRFLFLYSFLKKCQNKKVMVFLNRGVFVKFYCELLNNFGFPVMCIHGSLKLHDKLSVFRNFCTANSGILLCTDIAARGLDFPPVDWVVQFDPPHKCKFSQEYIHRVSRTGKGLHGQGHAVLILSPKQLNSLLCLKKARISLNKFNYKLTEEADIQMQVNKLLSENEFLKDAVENALKSYQLASGGNLFNPFSCSESFYLNKVAKSFGFTASPSIMNGLIKRKKLNDVSSEDQTKKKKHDVESANTSEHKSNEESQSLGGSTGNEILSNTSFKSLTTVSEQTLKAIENMGFTKMTRIQAECIPPLLRGSDLVCKAKTGSGKTLAFLIPVVEKLFQLEKKCKDGIGCVILSPTRELTTQIYDTLQKLIAYHSLTCGLLMVGQDNEQEILTLSKHDVNIVVTTPDRLCCHLSTSPELQFDNLKCLVLDEADELLDMGFQKQIEIILNALPKSRQTILFTATCNKQTDDLARLAMNENPIYIGVGDEDKIETSTGLVQGYAVCPPEKRFLFLYTFLNKYYDKKVLVFLNTSKSVDFYQNLLNNLGRPVTYIHGNLNQTIRTSTYQDFCSAKNGILLCSNVAARGLDIPAVDWIVQFDAPKEYIHRVGRTARGIHWQGHSVIVLFPEQLSILQDFEKASILLQEFDYVLSDEVYIQSQVNKILSENDSLKCIAKEGFKSYVRSVGKKKNPFVSEVAESFGLSREESLQCVEDHQDEKDITSSQEESEPKPRQLKRKL